MGGIGIELRMRILRDAADQQLIKPFRTHGWTAEISAENEAGEYLIITVKKLAVTHKVALMYTSATDNRHYKTLDAIVDHIFINGELYQIKSYAYNIKTPVTPIDEFFPVLVAWNKELAPETGNISRIHCFSKVRRITAENPLEEIWARLNQFSSVKLAEKLVKRRALEESATLTEDKIKTKAEGVAFALRNASDYFRGVPFESLNKRILSLYYGTLALAFAEMLVSPTGPSDLDEVEGKTKYGHGLYTVPSATEGFGGLNIGGLGSGFFPQWASFLGHDVTHFPKAKAKTLSDLERLDPKAVVTMCDLLAALPEIGDLFLEVFSAPFSWIIPVYSIEANSGPSAFKQVPKIESSYIHLIDRSGRLAEERLTEAGWPITEITKINNDGDGQTFLARVDHTGCQYWFEALPIHRSPFNQSGTLIFPIMGGIYEYRAIAMIVLYAFSIMVRYMPSVWRRVEGGDWDQHLALVKTALGVLERLLPEEFLESIIGERVSAHQPGGLF